MALLQMVLFILFGMSIATMFSGFMLARRMGMYLMLQVMMSMLFMLVSLVGLLVGVFIPPTPALFDLLHSILLLDFIIILLVTLMEFIQVVPILMKTMQGGPIHSSHMTNLLLSLFLTLGLVIYYVDIARIVT